MAGRHQTNFRDVYSKFIRSVAEHFVIDDGFLQQLRQLNVIKKNQLTAISAMNNDADKLMALFVEIMPFKDLCCQVRLVSIFYDNNNSDFARYLEDNIPEIKKARQKEFESNEPSVIMQTWKNPEPENGRQYFRRNVLTKSLNIEYLHDSDFSSSCSDSSVRFVRNVSVQAAADENTGGQCVTRTFSTKSLNTDCRHSYFDRGAQTDTCDIQSSTDTGDTVLVTITRPIRYSFEECHIHLLYQNLTASNLSIGIFSDASMHFTATRLIHNFFLHCPPNCPQTELPKNKVYTVIVDKYLTKIRFLEQSLSSFFILKHKASKLLRRWLGISLDILIIFFLIDEPDSFEITKNKWLPLIRSCYPDITFILVGENEHLRSHPATTRRLQKKYKDPVSYIQGDRCANDIENCIYLECSSETKKGVNDLFATAITNAISRKYSENTLNHNRRCRMQ